MAYNKTIWIDKETDVDAAGLNNIEEGVKTLESELVELKSSINSKAPSVHTHDEIKALETTVASKSPSDHIHTDLSERIKAVEDRPSGESVDLKPLTDKIATLETSLSEALIKIKAIEDSITAGGDLHVHEDLELKITTLQSGKAELQHTHNSSEIITSKVQ